MRLKPETEHQEKMDANLKEPSEQKRKPSKQKQMPTECTCKKWWQPTKKNRNQDGRHPREEGRLSKGGHM
jgi:hypothetical protein